MCTPNFLVCAHLTTCVSAHAHSLEGTLPMTASEFVKEDCYCQIFGQEFNIWQQISQVVIHTKNNLDMNVALIVKPNFA